MKLARKRRPKGDTVTDKQHLVEGTWYRTPMDDSSHLWCGDGNATVCGRYLEYPWYYHEGWDVFFGEYWVQVDTRKNGQCALCRTVDKKAKQDAVWLQEIEAAADKYGVTPKYPEDRRPDRWPPRLRPWQEAASRLYVG